MQILIYQPKHQHKSKHPTVDPKICLAVHDVLDGDNCFLKNTAASKDNICVPKKITWKKNLIT